MTPDTIALIAEKRVLYERLRLCIVACGRSLLECQCWHYDKDRLASLSRMAEHIRDASQAMNTLLHEIEDLEQRVLS